MTNQFGEVVGEKTHRLHRSNGSKISRALWLELREKFSNSAPACTGIPGCLVKHVQVIEWSIQVHCTEIHGNSLKMTTHTIYGILNSCLILLMEEIPNNHLECIKPCKQWDIHHINWCRISSINRMAKCINPDVPFKYNQLLLVTTVTGRRKYQGADGKKKPTE